MTLGGVTPNGQDGVSDMTYIFLKVTEMLSIRDVNVNARFKPGVNSDAYLSRVCEVNFITAGTPSMHNDDAVFAALRPHGYDLEDIRDWSATGCVEPTITGKHMAHTGSILMNLVAGFEMTLNNGRHPLIRGHAGPSTGDVSSGDFETAQFRPTPLLSALMGGTLQSGRDVTRGGAQFNSSGTSNIGLADVTDSLLAIKKLVFDDKRVSFAQLKRALDTNFEEDPALKALAEHGVPHFGSGDEEALAMANRVLSLVHDMYGKHEIAVRPIGIQSVYSRSYTASFGFEELSQQHSRCGSAHARAHGQQHGVQRQARPRRARRP
ncbi:MAG: pyruvate formate lyase family protein [Deltaproteobacteria bacterium]|nr:pyruvate formate lyase family protein [Deltaproteobacteria bacterium]